MGCGFGTAPRSPKLVKATMSAAACLEAAMTSGLAAENFFVCFSCATFLVTHFFVVFEQFVLHLSSCILLFFVSFSFSLWLVVLFVSWLLSRQVVCFVACQLVVERVNKQHKLHQ